MFGEASRVKPANKCPQAREMVGVQSAFAADGKPHTVYRNWKTVREVAELCNGTAAVAHVVFGVHFEPADCSGISCNVCEVLRFVSYSRRRGQ